MNHELRKILYDINPDIEMYQDENLIETELLNSLDIITLIGELETYYRISIEAEDISISNFETIVKIEALLEKYMNV